MEKETVIKVENLSKKFCRNLKRSMFYGTLDVLSDMAKISTKKDKLRKSEFWVLDNINFEVKKGETFGLVGANGSGKTTLLRMISGIFPPDKGKISVKGRIGALIAVGAGFHPHMTGRENIFLNGSVLGMSQEEIKDKFDSIVNFAEIGDFLDAPVSTYSSGMYVRLGFAIAIHSDPDIVLVDEILAVGDSKFQRKCLDKIKEMRKNGVTFFLVSHNMQNIEAMCDRALLLDHGKQIMLSSPQDIVPVYEILLKTGKKIDFTREKKKEKKSHEECELKLIRKYKDLGTEDIRVNKIILKNNQGIPQNNFLSDEALIIEADITLPFIINKAILWLTLVYVNDRKKEDLDIECLGVKKEILLKEGRSKIIIKFDKSRLTTGEYRISFDIFDDIFTNPYSQGHYGYFYIKKEIPTMLRVGAGSPFCWAEPKIEINTEQ